LLAKYYPDTPPSFVSLEGFIDAMVLVEGLKRAGKDLTRDKFITDEVHPTMVCNGQPILLTDWSSLGK
jgi:hypothetical protein